MKRGLIGAMIAIALIPLLGGCDGGDVLGQLMKANMYSAAVSQQMAAKGYDGIPSDVYGFAMYSKALAESIAWAVKNTQPQANVADWGKGDDGDTYHVDGRGLAAAFNAHGAGTVVAE